MPYDVWVHREVDALVSFPFGESIARELRRLGIDARVEPPPELDVPPNPNPNTPSRRPTLAQRPLRSEARAGFVSVRMGEGPAREGPLMVEFGWRGLLQALKLQRKFRALLQRRAQLP